MWKDKVSSFHTPCLLSYLRPLKQTSKGSLAESPSWDLFCYFTCMPGKQRQKKKEKKKQPRGNANTSNNHNSPFVPTKPSSFLPSFFLILPLTLLGRGAWDGGDSEGEGCLKKKVCPPLQASSVWFQFKGPDSRRDLLRLSGGSSSPTTWWRSAG